MTTRIWHAEWNRELDLASCPPDEFQAIIGLAGKLTRKDRVLVCVSEDGILGDNLHLYKHPRGGWQARHFAGESCGQEHGVVGMTDQHRRQVDYFARAVETAGYFTEREHTISTGKRRVDLLAMGGGTKAAFEIQHSALTPRLGRRRTADIREAGISPAWFNADEQMPSWTRYVPTIGTTLRTDWHNMPAPNEATATGISDFQAAVCEPGVFKRCPVTGGTQCGKWHYKRSPVGGITVDEAAVMLAEGALVAVSYGRNFETITTPDGRTRLEALTFDGATGPRDLIRDGRVERPTRSSVCARPTHSPRQVELDVPTRVEAPRRCMPELAYGQCQRCGQVVRATVSVKEGLCRRCAGALAAGEHVVSWGWSR